MFPGADDVPDSCGLPDLVLIVKLRPSGEAASMLPWGATLPALRSLIGHTIQVLETDESFFLSFLSSFTYSFSFINVLEHDFSLNHHF